VLDSVISIIQLQILDPLIESQILAAKMRIHSTMLQNGTGDSGSGTGFTMEVIGRSGGTGDAKGSYYTYTPLSDLPSTNWFKILGLVNEVAKKAIPVELVDSVFFDAVYNTFGNAFRSIPDDPDQLDQDEFNAVKGRLEKCAQAPFDYDKDIKRTNILTAMSEGKVKLEDCPLKVRCYICKLWPDNSMYLLYNSNMLEIL